MSESSFRAELQDGVPVIRLVGDVDMRSAPALREALLSAAQLDAGAVVVSLRDAAYFDSSVIYELSAFGERLRLNRQALLIALPTLPSAQAILRICRLPERYDSYATVEEAVASVGRAAAGGTGA